MTTGVTMSDTGENLVDAGAGGIEACAAADAELARRRVEGRAVLAPG